MITNMGKQRDGDYRMDFQCDAAGCPAHSVMDVDGLVVVREGEGVLAANVDAFLRGAKWMAVTNADGSHRLYCPEHTAYAVTLDTR